MSASAASSWAQRQRRGDVEALGAAFVVGAGGGAHAPEVEAQRPDRAAHRSSRQQVEQLVDQAGVHRSAVERVGVGEHGQRHGVIGEVDLRLETRAVGDLQRAAAGSHGAARYRAARPRGYRRADVPATVAEVSVSPTDEATAEAEPARPAPAPASTLLNSSNDRPAHQDAQRSHPGEDRARGGRAAFLRRHPHPRHRPGGQAAGVGHGRGHGRAERPGHAARATRCCSTPRTATRSRSGARTTSSCGSGTSTPSPPSATRSPPPACTCCEPGRAPIVGVRAAGRRLREPDCSRRRLGRSRAPRRCGRGAARPPRRGT